MSAQLDSFVRERNAELSRRVRMLDAERQRLERLLAMTLRVASADGRDCDPLALLEVIAALSDVDLSRPAWIEDEKLGRLVALVRKLRFELEPSIA